FSASDGVTGRELWKSYGTSATTARLDDIAPGAASSDPGPFAARTGKLVFAATDLGGDRELWQYPLPDSTAPTIAPTVAGTLGANGWYVSNVSVSFNVQDPETPFVSTGCTPTNVIADTPLATFTCTAESEGGSSSQ